MKLPSIRHLRLLHRIQAQPRRLLLREREYLLQASARLTGFRFVSIVRNEQQRRQARWLHRKLCSQGGHTQCWLLGPPDCGALDVCTDTSQLPVASHSIDAVILPHSLDLAARPHQMLREVDRVLCERGQLIILGYNPLRPAALMGQLLWPWRKPSLPRGLTPARLADWLGLLNYEVERVTCYGSVDVGANWPQWSQRVVAPLRPAYVVHARKRRIPVTPVGLRQRLTPRLSGLPVAQVGSTRAHLRRVK